jgi:hypothetical protein
MAFQTHAFAYTLMPENGRLGILFQRIFDYPIHSGSNNVIDTLFHWLNLIVVATGISFTIKQVRNNSLERDPNLILLLGTLLLAIPMLFTPFDWDRYYLYPIYFGCIFFQLASVNWHSNIKYRRKHNE